MTAIRQVLTIAALLFFSASLAATAEVAAKPSLRIGDATRNGDNALRHAALIFALKHNAEITINRVSAETALEKLRAGDFSIIVAESRALPAAPEFPSVNHCWEALAVYVNPANPCRNLTLQQLRDIVAARKPSWLKINGDRADMHRFTLSAKAENSGLLAKLLPTPAMTGFTGLNTVEEILLMTADDPVAIGIAPLTISLPANVATVKINGIQPDLDAIRQNRYPLLIQYRRLTTVNPPAVTVKFLDYLKSLEFDRILLDNGMIPPSASKISGR